MPIKVLLDTSILLLSLEIPFDIFGETEKLLQTRVEFLVLEEVRDELRKFSKKRTAAATRAGRALEMIAKRKILRIESMREMSADDALIQASRELRAVVATADSQLRKRLRNLDVPVLSLRGRRLSYEPEIAEYWSSTEKDI